MGQNSFPQFFAVVLITNDALWGLILHEIIASVYDLPIVRHHERIKQVAPRALFAAALRHPDVTQEPPPEVWLTEFGDNSVNFELLVWVGR